MTELIAQINKVLDQNHYVRRFDFTRIETKRTEEIMDKHTDYVEATKLGQKICGDCDKSIADNTQLGKDDCCWLGWCKRYNIITSQWDGCDLFESK